MSKLISELLLNVLVNIALVVQDVTQSQLSKQDLGTAKLPEKMVCATDKGVPSLI